MRTFQRVTVCAALLAVALPAAAVRPEDFGAVGDGVRDDSDALQRALAASRSVELRAGRTYRIERGVRLQDGQRLRGEGSAAILMSGGTRAMGRVAAQAAQSSPVCKAFELPDSQFALLVEGLRDVVIDGVRIVREEAPDHYAYGLVIRGSQGITVSHSLFEEFAGGLMLVVDSSSDVRITNNGFRARQTRLACQFTAISVDDNRVKQGGGPVSSENIDISGNTITGLSVDAALRERRRFETDGINIASPDTRRIRITRNVIREVGEGIDVFGSDGVIEGNVVEDARIFGIKLIHGASGWTVSGNEINRPGKAGILLSGSGSVKRDTESNRIVRNVIRDVGADGTWSRFTTAGISIERNGELGFPARNIIEDNKFQLNRSSQFGVFCESPLPNSIGRMTYDRADWKRAPVRECPAVSGKK